MGNQGPTAQEHAGECEYATIHSTGLGKRGSNKNHHAQGPGGSSLDSHSRKTRKGKTRARLEFSS